MEKVLQYAQFAEECRKLGAKLIRLDDKTTLEMMAARLGGVTRQHGTETISGR